MLREGKTVLGLTITIPDPFVAELVGTFNFDWVNIDMEHSPLSMSQVQTMLIALRPTEATVTVRAEWNDPVKVKRILDIGAEGVVFPWVATGEEAERAVASTRYPPDGIRGWGPRRAGWINGPPDEYAQKANENILVLIQVERAEAVERLDEILRVPGVDGVIIGPADLSWSMGFRPGTSPEKLDAMIERVLEKCKEHNVAFGMFTGGFDVPRKWLRRGGQIFSVGQDAAIIREGLQELKRGIEELSSELGV